VALSSLSDRIFIDRMVGTSELGVYSVGYQFGMAMGIITTAVNLTWTPWLYEKLAKATYQGKRKIVRNTYGLWLVYIMLAMLLSVFAYFIIPILTSLQFIGSHKYVMWVALAYAFHGMYFLIFPYGVHVGRTSFLGYTTAIAAVINLMGNYFLIKMNGPIGAAQSTLLSYIIMFLLTWWYSNKLYPMPWRLKFNNSE
jgi:O-antigen/teichoic acid export membrane protein